MARNLTTGITGSTSARAVADLPNGSVPGSGATYHCIPLLGEYSLHPDTIEKYNSQPPYKRLQAPAFYGYARQALVLQKVCEQVNNITRLLTSQATKDALRDSKDARDATSQVRPKRASLPTTPVADKDRTEAHSPPLKKGTDTTGERLGAGHTGTLASVAIDEQEEEAEMYVEDNTGTGEYYTEDEGGSGALTSASDTVPKVLDKGPPISSSSSSSAPAAHVQDRHDEQGEANVYTRDNQGNVIEW
jgi:hypothetical protein